MVTDEQVRRLRKLSNTEKDQAIAASKAGMDPTTARRYLGLERLPSELKRERHWRTREDPFSQVWDAVQRQVQESPGLEPQRKVVRVTHDDPASPPEVTHRSSVPCHPQTPWCGG